MVEATLARSTTFSIGLEEMSKVVNSPRSAIDDGREVRELSRRIRQETPLEAIRGSREEKAFMSRDNDERDNEGPQSTIFLRAISIERDCFDSERLLQLSKRGKK